MENKDLKTPWQYKFYSNGGTHCILNVDGRYVAFGRGGGKDEKEILEHIVHCVNTHDELVEALEAAKTYLEDIKKGTFKDETITLWMRHNQLQGKMESALKKATN